MSMIQNIQSSALNTIQYSTYGKAYKTGTTDKTEEAAEKSQKQHTSSGNTMTSIDGDTITISAAGKEYAKTAATTGTSAADSTAAVVNDNVVSAASATQTQNELSALDTIQTDDETATTDDTTEETTYSLSGYSESQLKELLQDGKISQAEYQAELRSRESNTAADLAE